MRKTVFQERLRSRKSPRCRAPERAASRGGRPRRSSGSPSPPRRRPTSCFRTVSTSSERPTSRRTRSPRRTPATSAGGRPALQGPCPPNVYRNFLPHRIRSLTPTIEIFPFRKRPEASGTEFSFVRVFNSPFPAKLARRKRMHSIGSCRRFTRGRT